MKLFSWTLPWFFTFGLTLTWIQSCSSEKSRCPTKEPVCGTDGVTYRDICHLEKAKLEDIDLQVLYDGSCYENYKNSQHLWKLAQLKSYRLKARGHKRNPKKKKINNNHFHVWLE